MSDHTVAVIGGGLAGLETARRLAAAGVSVTVFEAEETVGGRVRTQHSEGFTLDRGFRSSSRPIRRPDGRSTSKP